jgi:hypothetical protein
LVRPIAKVQRTWLWLRRADAAQGHSGAGRAGAIVAGIEAERRGGTFGGRSKQGLKCPHALYVRYGRGQWRALRYALAVGERFDVVDEIRPVPRTGCKPCRTNSIHAYMVGRQGESGSRSGIGIIGRALQQPFEISGAAMDTLNRIEPILDPHVARGDARQPLLVTKTSPIN